MNRPSDDMPRRHKPGEWSHKPRPEARGLDFALQQPINASDMFPDVAWHRVCLIHSHTFGRMAHPQSACKCEAALQHHNCRVLVAIIVPM
jgi:hypothetical protein